VEMQRIFRDYFENLNILEIWRNEQISRHIWPSEIEPRGYKSPK
jgi:hypothetical protein